MPRIGVVLAVVLAGCSAEEAAREPVSLVAPGAAWMAVRTSDDQVWRRFDAPVVRVETSGVIEAAVVCGDDTGVGWTWLATAADGGDDATIERACDAPQGASVVFDVVGRVDAIYVAGEVSYGPTQFTLGVPPGVHDVVAVQAGEAGVVERVQLVRGVSISGVGTRVAIDIDALGQPTDTATITLNGLQPFFVSYRGETAGGTRFNLEGRGGVRTLPPALRVDGDRELVYAPIEDGRFVEVEIQAGPNLLTTEAPTVAPTFGTNGKAITVSWPATDSWDVMRLRASLVVDGTPAAPIWDLIAYPGAIEQHTRDGAVSLSLAPPDVDGWDAAWFPDTAGPHRRSATWQRNRADGTEGYFQGESVSGP